MVRRRLHGEAAAGLLDDGPLSMGRLLRHVRECDDVRPWHRRAEAAAVAALDAGDDRAGVLLLQALLERPDLPDARRLPLAHRVAEAAASGLGALGDIGPQVVERVGAVVDRAGDLVAADGSDGPRLGEIRLQLGRLLLQLGSSMPRRHVSPRQPTSSPTTRSTPPRPWCPWPSPEVRHGPPTSTATGCDEPTRCSTRWPTPTCAPGWRSTGSRCG